MIKKLKGGPYFLFYKRIDTRKFSEEKMFASGKC